MCVYVCVRACVSASACVRVRACAVRVSLRAWRVVRASNVHRRAGGGGVAADAAGWMSTQQRPAGHAPHTPQGPVTPLHRAHACTHAFVHTCGGACERDRLHLMCAQRGAARVTPPILLVCPPSCTCAPHPTPRPTPHLSLESQQQRAPSTPPLAPAPHRGPLFGPGTPPANVTQRSVTKDVGYSTALQGPRL